MQIAGKEVIKVQRGSFISEAYPSRRELPAPTKSLFRNQNRDGFALYLENAAVAFLSSSALPPPARPEGSVLLPGKEKRAGMTEPVDAAEIAAPAAPAATKMSKISVKPVPLEMPEAAEMHVMPGVNAMPEVYPVSGTPGVTATTAVTEMQSGPAADTAPPAAEADTTSEMYEIPEGSEVLVPETCEAPETFFNFQQPQSSGQLANGAAPPGNAPNSPGHTAAATAPVDPPVTAGVVSAASGETAADGPAGPAVTAGDVGIPGKAGTSGTPGTVTAGNAELISALAAETAVSETSGMAEASAVAEMPAKPAVTAVLLAAEAEAISGMYEIPEASEILAAPETCEAPETFFNFQQPQSSGQSANGAASLGNAPVLAGHMPAAATAPVDAPVADGVVSAASGEPAANASALPGNTSDDAITGPFQKEKALEDNLPGRDTEVGNQGGADGVRTETFLPEEREEYIFASMQNVTNEVESLITTDIFPSTAEASAAADFSERIIARIVEQGAARLAGLSRPGVQELRLRLQPEFLGEVLLRVRRLEGALSAEIITRHPAVKELLDGQVDVLRQRFQEANLNIERLDILLQDGAENGFTPPRDDGSRGSSSIFKAEAAGENAAIEENGDLFSGLQGGSSLVDYLA